MPIKKNCFKLGFSLVELIVVISIIAILASVGLVVYSNIDKQSRDNRRFADLKQVQAALEQYRNDTGFYPQSLSFDSGGKINKDNNVYLDILPRDPLYSAGGSYLNYYYVPRPATQLNDLVDCNNDINGSPTPKCVDYCLYAHTEGTSNTSNNCFSDKFNSSHGGYNYSIRRGRT